MSKKNHPLVTIVTVVYNAEDLIEETIKSVLKQKFANYEYIVIDGASTDKTLEIINKYKNNIAYLVSESDNGIYDAMNKAIELANGEWINFMNAGDLFSDADVLHKIFANSENSNNFDFIYGAHYWKHQDGKLSLTQTNPISSIWQRIAFSHQSLFSRTKLMKAHKFNLSYDIVSDYEFYFHHYMKGYKFFDVGFPVSTVLAGGFSDNNFMRRTIERWAVVIKYKDEPEVHKFYLDIISKNTNLVPNMKNTVNYNCKKISIIVPNYNNAKYLPDCLNSLLSQSHKNLEIIIIDDCSTDDSRRVLEEYHSKYSNIKLIYNKQNQGVTKNRHKAIMQSTGDYITTLDSDDYLIDNTKLEKELELLLHYKNQGKDIITFSNIVLVDENKKRIGYQAGKNIKEGDIFNPIISRDCMIPRDFLFTKEMYLNVGGFDFNIPIYEDWDLKIRLSAKYHFHHVDIDGIGYRRHGSGLSSAPRKEHKKWLETIFLKNFYLIKSSKKKLQISNMFYEKALN